MMVTFEVPAPRVGMVDGLLDVVSAGETFTFQLRAAGVTIAQAAGYVPGGDGELTRARVLGDFAAFLADTLETAEEDATEVDGVTLLDGWRVSSVEDARAWCEAVEAAAHDTQAD